MSRSFPLLTSHQLLLMFVSYLYCSGLQPGDSDNYIYLASAINYSVMPFVKVWIHAVWATKSRKPLLNTSFRQEIFDHIAENAFTKGILIDAVNGHVEHVHCMFRLKNDQTISKVMQLIKGESSYWVNKNMNLKHKLQWQACLP